MLEKIIVIAMWLWKNIITFLQIARKTAVDLFEFICEIVGDIKKEYSGNPNKQNNVWDNETEKDNGVAITLGAFAAAYWILTIIGIINGEWMVICAILLAITFTVATVKMSE